MIDGYDPADECCLVSRRLAMEARSFATATEAARRMEYTRVALDGLRRPHRREGGSVATTGSGLLTAWVVLGDFGGTPGIAGGMVFSSQEKAFAAAKTWAIPRPQVQQVIIQLEDGRVVDPRWLDVGAASVPVRL